MHCGKKIHLFSFQSEEFGQASLEAPVYKGQVKIHADLFIEKISFTTGTGRT
jgi:hypothetical protein